MNSSSAGIAFHRGWAIVIAAVTVIGLSGCVTSPDVGSQSSEGALSDAPSSSSATNASPAPAGSVGPVEQPELPVVTGAIDEEIELSTGFVIALGSISATTVKAETPGDVAGTAIEVVVEVTNTSAETQTVDSAVVTLETAEGDLGIPTIAGGASALGGDLAPQSSAEGRYLFMLDPAEGRDVTISVNYAAGEPVAQFTGRTP